MAMAKILGKIRAKVERVIGNQEIQPTGHLTMKRTRIRQKVNSAHSASFFAVTGAAEPSGSIPQDFLNNYYYQNSGIEVSCCPPDDGGSLWVPPITQNPEQAQQLGPTISAGGMQYPCQPTLLGAVRVFEYDWGDWVQTRFIDKGADDVLGFQHIEFCGFPQYCTPRAVSIQVLEDISGSGDSLGRGAGRRWIDRVGLGMLEQGGNAYSGGTFLSKALYQGEDSMKWLDHVTPLSHPQPGLPFVAIPRPCAGSMPKFYMDRTYFYNSASMANCCFPPLSGAGDYAVYGSNQGGQGIFTHPRFGNGVTGSDDGIYPESDRGLTEIFACLDRENVIYDATASFIQMTQLPINNVRIALSDQLGRTDVSGSDITGRIRVCCYYDQIGGGYETSADFWAATPRVSASVNIPNPTGYYGNTGDLWGINRSCVSGTIVFTLVK